MNQKILSYIIALVVGIFAVSYSFSQWQSQKYASRAKKEMEERLTQEFTNINQEADNLSDKLVVLEAKHREDIAGLQATLDAMETAFSTIDLTVSGTTTTQTLVTNGHSNLQGNVSIGGNLEVAGNSNLQGNVSNSLGDFTIADALTQIGAGNQVTLQGNVDATNGLDVTGANLTVGGANFTVIVGSGNFIAAGTGLVNGTLNLASGLITDTTGTISFNDENLITTGTITGVNVTSGVDPGHTHTAYAPASGSPNYIQNQSVGGQAASFWITGTGRLDNTLTVSSGGASITGGINNNSGGITNTGAMAGVTSIQNAGSITIDLNAAATTTLTVTNSDGTNVADLSVEGGAILGNGLIVSAGAVTLPANAISDEEVSDTLTASNLVAALSVVSDPEVDDDITINTTKKIQATLTTTQLQLGYNGTTYTTFTISSVGTFTFDATGTTPKFVFKDPVDFDNNVTIGQNSSDVLTVQATPTFNATVAFTNATPFTVTSTSLINNLNADRVDGFDITAGLANNIQSGQSIATGLTSVTSFTATVREGAGGDYFVTVESVSGGNVTIRIWDNSTDAERTQNTDIYWIAVGTN